MGGWRWTSHSPTGSGPEGSSPNERGSGRSSASHRFLRIQPLRLYEEASAAEATRLNLSEFRDRWRQRLWSRAPGREAMVRRPAPSGDLAFDFCPEPARTPNPSAGLAFEDR